jgi:hypothetical protein
MVKTEGSNITGYYEAHDVKQKITGTITDNNFTVFTTIGEKKVKFTGAYTNNEITGVLSGIDNSDPSNFRGIKVM